MHSVPHADRLELDGSWRFQLLHRPDADVDDAAWGDAVVPGLWTMQGTWDRPQYTNVQMPFRTDPPVVPEENPTGIYERTFELPAAWLGDRVVLHVGAAESVLIAQVNGVEVGVSKDSRLAAEFDISSAVRTGANTVRLTVVKWSDASFIEDQDQWWHGGLPRSVSVYRTRPTYLADVRAIGGLADDLTTGTLELDVLVAFAGGDAQDGWLVEASLEGVDEAFRASPGSPAPRAERREPVRPWWFLQGWRASGTPFDDELAADWAAMFGWQVEPTPGLVSWRVDVPDVTPWSAETPSLRSLTVRLRAPDGSIAEEASLRVGFRRVEVRGLDLLINGRRVLIHGVNRHDFDRFTGRVVSVDAMREDLRLMKRFGFDAVRTSHYPNDPAFLDLTDELGLYVIDEADIESHAFWGSLSDDPRYLTQWVERVARMALRDKHHPSVIAWSLGNESGYGANHDAAAAWLRRYDPSRPLHYEGAIRFDWGADAPVTDITCPMYPPIGAIVAHAQNGTQLRPLIMCEYSHAHGQLERHAGRVLGRDRVDPRAPGWVHLGVVGPRARADAPRRHEPPRVRRRLRRCAQRRQLLPRRAGPARSHAEARALGAPGDRGAGQGAGRLAGGSTSRASRGRESPVVP